MKSRDLEFSELSDDKITKHHLIGQHKKDLFNVLRGVNVVKLRRDKHKALHTLFTDDNDKHILEPKYQLRHFIDLIKPILTEHIYKRLFDITNLPNEKFYKQSLIKG